MSKSITPAKGHGAVMHARQAHDTSKADMDEGLRIIYGESPSDLHTVEQGASMVTVWLTRAVIGLGILAVGVLAALFIMSRGFFAGNKADPLTMSIVVPTDVKSGEEVTLLIPYQNTGNAAFDSLDIDVNLPASFLLISSSPEPTDTSKLLYSIGSLGSQSDGEIKIVGVWLSNVSSATTVQAIASYQPSNVSADFSLIATANIATNQSVFTEAVTGPSSAVPGEMLTYTATITNTGTQSIDNAELALTLPIGFVISSSTPPLPAGSTSSLWPVGTLAPLQTSTITFVGSFSSDVADAQQLIADVKIADLIQTSATWSTDVKGGDLRLTLVGNGSPGNITVNPGSNLDLSFRLENAGKEVITDASVLIDFQPGTGVPIVWSKAALDGGTLTKDGVQFSTKVIGIVAPGDKKTFNLSFPLKTALVATDLDSFTVVAHAATATTSLLSTPLTVSLNGSVSLSLTARYYDEHGVALGSGSFPPVIGQATSFQITWHVAHAIHALKDITVSATLPPGVEFTNASTAVADAGTVSYDASSRTVKWTISELIDSSGTNSVSFFVTATPEAADDGTYMKLLGVCSFKANDAKTSTKLERSVDAITTALPDDKTAAGKGLVSQ